MTGPDLVDLFAQGLGALLVLGASAHVVGLIVRTRVELRAARVEHQLRMRVLEQSLASETERRENRQRLTEGTWSGTRKFRIARKTEEAKDIMSFYLVAHDGKTLAPFHPGQFLTFSLRIPGEQKPLIRCYSLSDSPFEREHYRVSIKKLGPPPNSPECPPGRSSTHFHENLQEGDIVDVRAPSGGFFLDLEQRRPIVLIAGGVGVTPMLSMLKAACAAGYGQDVWFFYGLRSGVEHAFRDEMERCEAEHGNVKLRYCYSAPTVEDTEANAYHLGEMISVDLFKRVLPSNNYVFYICGPPPMMAALSEGLAEWGVPQADIRSEAFGPASVKRAETSAPQAGAQFEVRFERSGKSLPWIGGGNLLDFAEDNGITIDSGCRAGSCGTCLTAVKAGSVEYPHPPDTPPEAGSCLVCMARPTSNLVLDA